MQGLMNRKVFFVVLSLLLVISVAGCTENLNHLEKIGSGIVSGVSGPSLQDVAGAPQKYVGKEITLTGKLEVGLLGDTYMEDDNGYVVNLRLPGVAGMGEWIQRDRILQGGKTYTFSGKVEYVPKIDYAVFHLKGVVMKKQWAFVVGGT